MHPMADLSVDELCELGQEQLIATRYLEAEATLARAEALAQLANDWDILSRLYMPLQEARRQRRQRCGEGVFCLNLCARGPQDLLDPSAIVATYPTGQLLVAGWGTIEPAKQLRAIARERQLYMEVFLGAVHPVGSSRIILIAPEELTPLPPIGSNPSDLEAFGGLILPADELPPDPMAGTPQTYGYAMALWERLHTPFLATADASPALLDKVVGYRRTIQVDYACELAHQKLSAVARELARQARS